MRLAFATMTGPPPAPGRRIRFGAFQFEPDLRRLERGGVEVALSSRAIDILAVLTERPGEVVTKRELLERVWPDTVVVDAALRFHMVGLRRALGGGESSSRVITTVAGRGYCFVGEAVLPSPVEDAPTRTAFRPLPSRPTKVVGRDAVVEALLRRLGHERFVTIVGPGGIGKTTVALLVAHDWIAAGRGAAVFVDLVDLLPENPDGAAEALCAVLGVAPQEPGALPCALDHLRAREVLLVLDTCEGAIDAAARLAESLMASTPGVRVLATSREALRAEGEVVELIHALAAPPSSVQLTAREALTYPSVRLFVERVAANWAGFELSDQQAAIVGGICRELDGMALAIELAAGRVEAFGIQQVADMLATEFALTWPGRRTAAPRQQTLGATLNWSHHLLDPSERQVFRRLSVFAGAFSLEAATAVCLDGQTSQTEVIEALSSLVAKSLIRTMTDGPRIRYRMLDTTRVYARAKLGECGEEVEVRQRQAHHYVDPLSRSPPSYGNPGETAEQIANIRVVLGWAFATEGMDSLAIELSAAAASLWLREGLPADSRRWTREALARLDRGIKVGSERDARIALASSLVYGHGISPASSPDVNNQRARFGGRNDLWLAEIAVPWGHRLRLAQFAAAQRVLDDSNFLGLAGGDVTVVGGFHWMAATTAHYRGDHELARSLSETILTELTEPARDLMRRLFGYDLEIGALRVLGYSQFFLGDVDAALSLFAKARERAIALNYITPLAHTPYWQAFVAYQLEDGQEVDRLTTPIIEAAKPNSLQPAVGSALAIHGLSLMQQGDLIRGRRLVDRGRRTSRQADWRMLDDFVHAEMALALVRRQSPAEAQVALASVEEPAEENCHSPEILRIKGEIAGLAGDLPGAEAHYLDAMEIAERQGALFWRLRAATSFAVLKVSQGRPAEAAAILAPVYDQISRGQMWPDLRRAADCLEECRRALKVAPHWRGPSSADRPGLFDA